MTLRQLENFFRMNSALRALLIEAALWLLVARLMLFLLPFRRVAARLGKMVSPSDDRAVGGKKERSHAEVQIATQISWALRRAAYHVPFEAVCLPRAIAGRMMLRRRGVPSVLRLGTALPDQACPALRAHAWLEAAGCEVTGFPVAAEFTEIASFV
jgi:hypothetical protein